MSMRWPMPRILHVLDHSLPAHSGYTFRTRALMKAQTAKGWEVAGVTGVRHPEPGPGSETVDGLTFYRTPQIAPAITASRLLVRCRTTGRITIAPMTL